MSDPNYHEIDATIAELDEQIEALQIAKRDFWKGIRDEHGKKLTDQIKLAVKLNRMDSDKRGERDEIEEGAFRILAILQKPRAPRAARVASDVPDHDPETGEITEQPETAHQTPMAVNGDSAEAATAAPSQSVDILPGEDDCSKDRRIDAALAAPHSNPQASSSRQADSPASTSPEPGTHSDDFHPERIAFLNKPVVLKPLCLHPGEECSGYGSTTCHACLKAAAESEAA